MKSPSVRQNRRRKSRTPIVARLLVLALASEVAAAGLTSPRFAVRQVAVTGNTRVATSQILSMAGNPIGTNLFRLSTHRMAKRIEAVPRVRSAVIARIPPGRVEIRVTERTPQTLVAAGGAYYLVDESGIPFAPLEGKELPLPALRIDPEPVVVLGKPIVTDGYLAGVHTLISTEKALGWRPAVQIDRDLNVCLNKGDFSVRLGAPREIEKKLNLLKGLLQADPDLPRRARYVDVSVPEAPALMPREPSSPVRSGSISPRVLALGER